MKINEKSKKRIMREKLALGLFGVVFFAFYSFVAGCCLMIMWNWLMPEIFNLKEITLFQSIGFLFLYYLMVNYYIIINRFLNNK